MHFVTPLFIVPGCPQTRLAPLPRRQVDNMDIFRWPVANMRYCLGKFLDLCFHIFRRWHVSLQYRNKDWIIFQRCDAILSIMIRFDFTQLDPGLGRSTVENRACFISDLLG